MGYQKRLVDLHKNDYGVFRGRIKRSKEKGGGNGASNWRDPPAKEICVPMTRGDHRS